MSEGSLPGLPVGRDLPGIEFPCPVADNRRVIDLKAKLARLQNADGGFGPVADAPSEPATTAVSAMALDDQGARAWLEGHIGADGSVTDDVGAVANDQTAVALCALREGTRVESALDHIESLRGAFVASTTDIPHTPDVLGWPWTDGGFGWVEPSAWAVLALRAHRPTSSSLNDGIALLRDRECRGGGWNYGNRVAFGVELPPFAQTTAIGLLAVRGLDEDLEGRARAALPGLVVAEHQGLLSTATAAVALSAAGDPSAGAARSAAMAAVDDVSAWPTVDVHALAWAALAFDVDRALEVFAR
jgi:hypothetical protein